MGDSVQVLSHPYNNKLHANRNPGKLHKGHNVVAATTSIPTKYQTIVIDNSDYKGFGAKSRRFNYDKDGTENPGPGNYVGHTSIEKHGSSFSKKGTGGFASKDRRIFKHELPSGTGASIYALPSLLKSNKDFNQGGATSAFHKPIAQPSESKQKRPAPNSYDVLRGVNSVSKSNNVAANAAFKSGTKRLIMNQIESAQKPAPCQYNVSHSGVRPDEHAPCSSFKSTSKRKMAPSPPPIPGPGAYRPFEEIEPVQKTVFPRKHYLCISAPAMPLPKSPIPPGPGAYEMSDFEGPTKHYMSGSAFVSTTTRWQGHKGEGNLPGPAHYRPVGSTKQSFIYNALNRWI